MNKVKFIFGNLILTRYPLELFTYLISNNPLGKKGVLKEVHRAATIETSADVARLQINPKLRLLLGSGQDRHLR